MVDAELPVPATTMEPLLFLVRAALDRLTGRLAAQGQAVAALSITLRLDDGRGALPASALTRAHTVTREVRLPRPVARSTPLFERCRALLDTWPLSAPAIGVGVAIVAAAPLSGEQGDFLDAAWRDTAALDAALARLRAELGPNVVVKPVARDAYVPEKTGTWVESATPGEPVRGFRALSRSDGRSMVAAGVVRLTRSSRPNDYVELHCHSCFSLLDGAALPEVLAARAANLGMPALALTDHNELGGAVRFAQATSEVGIGGIIGAEVTVAQSAERGARSV